MSEGDRSYDKTRFAVIPFLKDGTSPRACSIVITTKKSFVEALERAVAICAHCPNIVKWEVWTHESYEARDRPKNRENFDEIVAGFKRKGI